MSQKVTVYVGAQKGKRRSEATTDDLSADELLSVAAFFFRAGMERMRVEDKP